MKLLKTLALVLLPALGFSQEKFTIIPAAGYAWRTAKLPSGIDAQTKDYLKQLKSGFNFDVGAYYRINPMIGLGAKYNLYTASASGSFSTVGPQGNPVVLNTETNDKIQFIGAGIIYSNFEEEVKHKLYYDLALGVISYNSQLPGLTMKGSNLGLAATISYMYAISPSIYIGPQIGYTAGVIKKMKINGVETDLGKDNYEGLQRVALNLGATFRF